MDAGAEPGLDRIARIRVGGENDSGARELARFVTEVSTRDVTGMDVRVVYRLDRFLRGGYNLSFLQAAFQVVVGGVLVFLAGILIGSS